MWPQRVSCGAASRGTCTVAASCMGARALCSCHAAGHVSVWNLDGLSAVLLSLGVWGRGVMERRSTGHSRFRRSCCLQKFCGAPNGDTSWTFRLVEAVAAGARCTPRTGHGIVAVGISCAQSVLSASDGYRWAVQLRAPATDHRDTVVQIGSTDAAAATLRWILPLRLSTRVPLPLCSLAPPSRPESVEAQRIVGGRAASP
jgi:hypothetical protein